MTFFVSFLIGVALSEAIMALAATAATTAMLGIE